MKHTIKKLFPYICMLTVLGFIGLRIMLVMSEGTDIAGIEQNVIYSTQMFLENGQLYATPAAAPFSITQYTPIYYYLCGYTALLLGYGPTDIFPLYVTGRSWDLIFNLITAFLVYRISLSLGLKKNKSLLLFTLSFALTLSHNLAVRPDSLTDLLGIASVYCFMRYYDRPEKKGDNLLLLFTVVLTALAVFSKQSGIQLILIFGGFCLLIRDWKTLLKLLAFSILIYGGFLLLFIKLYPSFLENVVGGIANGISLKNYITILSRNAVLFCFWPLILISIFFLVKNKSLTGGSLTERLLATCVLGTLLFAAATALKMGSTPQYFILFVNLSLLFVMNNLVQYKTYLLAAYVSLVILMFAAIDLKMIRHHQNLKQQRLSAMKTAAFISQDSGDAKRQGRGMPGAYIFFNLSTDTAVPSRQALNNIFYKNCLVPQIDILQYSTGPSQVVGYKNLENLFRTGKIKYLVESETATNFFMLRNQENIKRTKFRLVKNIDGYLIYKLISKN